MNEMTVKMRQVARELLDKGEVNLIIGWEKGRFFYQSSPVFITKPEEADSLVWDEFCHASLAKYLLDYQFHEGKIGLFVKGCDSRAVLRLMQDNQLDRDKVYLIGIPCGGLKDPDQAEALGEKAGELALAGRCRHCAYPTPLVYDTLLGEAIPGKEVARDFADVIEIENMTVEEKFEFWQQQFAKCIRCYACRNVCPACNCRECCFDQQKPDWLGKANNTSENGFYHLTRAMHVAGRCIECGECQRACPVGIPIMLLNKKIIKDINEFFGPYEAGITTEQKPPLGEFKTDDPEKFM